MQWGDRETALSSLAVEFVRWSQRKQRSDRYKAIFNLLIVPTVILTPFIFYLLILGLIDWRLSPQAPCRQNNDTRVLIKLAFWLRQGDKFLEINLCKEHLAGFNFEKYSISLERANFSDADLSGVILRNLTLKETDFTHADLFGANLSNVDFISSDLSNVDVTLANLTNAKFKNVRFNRTDFRDATLKDTIFINSDLSNAINLTFEQADRAKFCNTSLPNKINILPNRDCSNPKVKLRL
jgi:hypothetical protein